MKCPLCHGNGEIADPKRNRRAQVILLRQEGYGIREIQRMVGYKSPNSVVKILAKSLQRVTEPTNE